MGEHMEQMGTGRRGATPQNTAGNTAPFCSSAAVAEVAQAATTTDVRKLELRVVLMKHEAMEGVLSGWICKGEGLGTADAERAASLVSPVLVGDRLAGARAWRVHIPLKESKQITEQMYRCLKR